MKQIFNRQAGSQCAAGLMLAATLILGISTARAVIPEPDNILYGTIALDNALVTALMTNVIVEARRVTNGPVVASYRMGSSQQVGDYYSLRIPVESVAPFTNQLNSIAGDTLIISLRDASGLRAQTNFTVVERGDVLRVDFGMISGGDLDGDGLPDRWEIAKFGTTGNGPGTITTNGQTVLTHYIAGTDPNDPKAGFRLRINLTNDLKKVWFVASATEGVGYEGLARLYTLQYRPNLLQGFWTDVPGFVGLTGQNQVVNYFTPGAGPPGFYRVGISLAGMVSNPGTVDTDGDGLPDTWETFSFGTLSRNGSFVCVNGQTAWQNFTAGTDPNNPASAFKLAVITTNSQQVVTLQARRAQGTGYEGKTRYYTLESSTNSATGYLPVPGFSSMLGSDGVITYPVGNDAQRYFRARVYLQ